MAKEPENRIPRVSAAVFTAAADSLSEAQVKELKEKYGLDLKLKSHVEAIDHALASISGAMSYDRTHPGYDRHYDKTGVAMDQGLAGNPSVGNTKPGR